MLVPIIDGTKGAGKIAARAALVASRPASCLLLTAFRTRDHGNQMLTAARLPLDPTTHGGIRREARCWRISQSRKLWPRGCCWASQEDCPTALHSGVRCGLCQRQRLWTCRRKISALFGVQLLGSSPIIFDCALWHAPAGLKSDDNSAKITAQ